MKAVIFDMDGVIIDSEGWHDIVCEKMFTDFGIEFDREYVDSFCGTSIHEFWAHLKDKYKLSKSVNELFDLHVGNVISEMKCASPVDPISGVRELIEKTHLSNKGIALASSSPRILIDAILSELKLGEFFEISVSADDVTRSKPSPEIYELTAAKLGFSPSECVAIEDSAHGVAAAKDAGMYCIGIRALERNKQDLSRADQVFQTFSEVESCIFS